MEKPHEALGGLTYTIREKLIIAKRHSDYLKEQATA